MGSTLKLKADHFTLLSMAAEVNSVSESFSTFDLRKLISTLLFSYCIVNWLFAILFILVNSFKAIL
jgi:hypothetical protein